MYDWMARRSCERLLLYRWQSERWKRGYAQLDAIIESHPVV